MKIKISLAVAAVALILSVVIGLAIGNSFSNMLIKAFIFTALFFAMSFVSLQYLEKRVPEIFELKDAFSGLGSATDVDQLNEEDEIVDSSLDSDEDDSYSSYAGSNAESLGVGETKKPTTEFKDLGDHILVRDKKIKNEPKLMAEAIRQMLLKDED